MTGSMGSGSGAPAAPADPTAPALPGTPATPRVGRTVLVLGGVILVLAVVAVVVILATPRPTTSYPAGSPEAAFQAYYTAWQQQDLEAAYALFSDRIRGALTLDEYRTMDRDVGWSRQEDRRIVLAGSRVDGDRATLDLRVEQFSSGGLLGGGGTWSYDASVPLVRERGAWHVDEYLAGLELMPAPAEW